VIPESSRVFRALAGEAVRDAIRRRIVAAIAVVSLLSLLAVDGCTACGGPTLVQDGVEVQLPEVAGWAGMVIFAVLGLWSMVLAGMLASDHLAEPLSDGSAVLVLARPVGRSTFALARLVGALAIAFATAFVLLGGSTAMLYARNGVAIGEALWGGLACAGGATIVASLAMTTSLFVPRVATLFLVLACVGGIAGVNAFALFGVELTGIAWVLDRFGPPLGSALIAAVSGWIAPAAVPVDPLEISIRTAAWAVAGVSLLVVAFRGRDIAN
jgi:hypothetical protein